MIDSEAETQKKRVKDLGEKWLGPLGLLWWHIEYEWERGNIGDHANTLFFITVRFDYNEVILKVSLPLVKTQTDQELERAFVHECAHIFTVPLKDAASREVNREGMDLLEEHQASVLGRAFQYLRAHLADEAKPVEQDASESSGSSPA